MALHVTIIGPNVDSKKGDEDGKGGDNGCWQKDHCASAKIESVDRPEGVPSTIAPGASWYDLDLSKLSFKDSQWEDTREIMIWGDSIMMLFLVCMLGKMAN
jgi:hypothetical protein